MPINKKKLLKKFSLSQKLDKEAIRLKVIGSLNLLNKNNKLFDQYFASHPVVTSSLEKTLQFAEPTPTY